MLNRFQSESIMIEKGVCMNPLKSLIEERKILIAAHRGVSGADIPCNTIPAFELALKSGADILEMDLFQSTDGEIFIFHTGKEPYQLDRHIDLTRMSSQEIRAMRLVNVDFNATAFGLNTFDEILEQFKGRCILNLDRCFGFLEDVIKKVEAHQMKEQILLKNAPDDTSLKLVETFAPDYMFMPIFMEEDTKTERMNKMNIHYVGAELVFATESASIAQDAYIQKMHQAGKILWGNSLEYNHKIPLAAGHSDNVSLIENPDKGWGWLIDKGFDIIQTDWTPQCNAYVKERFNQ